MFKQKSRGCTLYKKLKDVLWKSAPPDASRQLYKPELN